MARYEVQGLINVDDLLEDGYVSVEPGRRYSRFYMTLPTYRALAACEGAIPRLVDTLMGRDGLHLLPRSVIEPDAAADLRLGLSIVEPEASDVCIYPPCGLPAETVHRDGFPLCSTHFALMQGWDDLVA